MMCVCVCTCVCRSVLAIKREKLRVEQYVYVPKTAGIIVYFLVRVTHVSCTAVHVKCTRWTVVHLFGQMKIFRIRFTNPVPSSFIVILSPTQRTDLLAPKLTGEHSVLKKSEFISDRKFYIRVNSKRKLNIK